MSNKPLSWRRSPSLSDLQTISGVDSILAATIREVWGTHSGLIDARNEIAKLFPGSTIKPLGSHKSFGFMAYYLDTGSLDSPTLLFYNYHLKVGLVKEMKDFA